MYTDLHLKAKGLERRGISNMADSALINKAEYFATTVISAAVELQTGADAGRLDTPICPGHALDHEAET